MKSITLRQIAELTDREKRQLRAAINYSNAMEYAAQQRRKKISNIIRQIESEDDYDS